MPHFAVKLCYDGTDYVGWQLQPPGRGRSVQGELEAALARLAGGARVAVVGAGRTDAGVHAAGQVASFDLPREFAPVDLVRALNGMLAPDARVLVAWNAPPGFHAQRSARGKLYRYILDTGAVRHALRRRYAGYTPFTLDENAVREAAAVFVGRHDFASLQSSGGSVKTSVRTVRRSEAAFVDADAAVRSLVYEVEADGFLRKMVRSMVGGLLAAGRGQATPAMLGRALLARDRRAWPAPVEACGLTLLRVDYDEMLE